MAVVNFNKKYFFKLLGTELDDQKLVDQITKMGFDVEDVNKDEISIDVTSNRPDVLDIVGFARALKNFLHRSNKFRYEIKDETPALEITVGKDVKVVRPFISALVVKNLKLDNISLKYLIEFTDKFSSTYGRDRKKLAIGLHNLDAVKPPLIYNAFDNESFVPLNDTKKMSFSEILEKHKKGIMYGMTLDSKSKKRYYPVLKDKEGILSLIPIINSDRTKVTAATKNILLDMTGTSKYIVDKAIDMLAASFIDMGGDVHKVKINYPDESFLLPAMEQREIEVPLVKMEKQIGVVIGYNNVISLANKMGYEAALLDKKIRFHIPEYRLDIINDQDVTEDIAIGYGYDYIQPTPVFAAQQGELEKSTMTNNELSELMIGLGFTESMNSYLTNEKTNFEKVRLNEKDFDYVKIKDAKAQSITMLRTWLLPSVLNDASQSVHESMPQKLFEIDMAFQIVDGKVDEHYNIAGLIIDPKANFNDAKAIIETIMKKTKKGYKIVDGVHKSFIDVRVGSIQINDQEVGVFGELHPEVLNHFGIEEPAIAFEIRL